jgi:hypothetical protein
LSDGPIKYNNDDNNKIGLLQKKQKLNLGSTSCNQIWLNPLVADRQPLLEQNGKFGGKKKKNTGPERERRVESGRKQRERESLERRSHHLFPRHSVFVSVHLPAWNGLTRAAAALCCLKRFGEDFQSILISSCLVQTYLYLSIYLSTSVQYDLAGDSFLSFWLLID